MKILKEVNNMRSKVTKKVQNLVSGLYKWLFGILDLYLTGSPT